MPSEFYYKVYLPSTDTYEYFKELTNKELLIILKYNTNADREGLFNYLETLIAKKPLNKLTLHRIDKCCVLTTMIAVCIKNELKLNAKCEKTDKDYTIPVNITEILNVISNIKYTSDNIDIKTDDIQLKIQFPRSLYIHDSQLNPIDLLTQIKTKDGVYDISDYTSSEKNQIINHLPGITVNNMLKSINNYINKESDTTFFTTRSPYDEEATATVYDFNLLNNTYLDFIVIIIGTGLMSFYQMVHGLTISNTMSVDYLMNITPAETQTYVDLIKENIEIRNKQTQDDQQNVFNPTG